MKLFAKARRMTTTFCAGIICITLAMLLLRVVGFGEMSAPAPEVAGTLQNEIDGDSRFLYRMQSNIYFAQPDAKGDVLIQNPETNKYLLSVTILLDGVKDPVYTTGSLTPGTSVSYAKLSSAGQKLEKGVYECTAQVAAIDPETLAVAASEDKTVTLYIGEKPPK